MRKSICQTLFPLAMLAFLFVPTAEATNFQFYNFDGNPPTWFTYQFSYGSVNNVGPLQSILVFPSQWAIVPWPATATDGAVLVPPVPCKIGVCSLDSSTVTLAALVNDGGLIEEGPIPSSALDMPVFASTSVPIYENIDVNAYDLSGGFPGGITDADGGESFQVADGTIAGLPGIEIGTAAMPLDPSTGWDNVSPYTGTIYLDEEAGLCPEPSSLYLLGPGLLTLAGVLRRKFRRG
jgi:hypothetical protein